MDALFTCDDHRHILAAVFNALEGPGSFAALAATNKRCAEMAKMLADTRLFTMRYAHVNSSVRILLRDMRTFHGECEWLRCIDYGGRLFITQVCANYHRGRLHGRYVARTSRHVILMTYEHGVRQGSISVSGPPIGMPIVLDLTCGTCDNQLDPLEPELMTCPLCRYRDQQYGTRLASLISIFVDASLRSILSDILRWLDRPSAVALRRVNKHCHNMIKI